MIASPWIPSNVAVARAFAECVSDVLDLLANGLTPDQVLRELPDLELPDITACLRLASRRIDHPIVAA